MKTFFFLKKILTLATFLFAEHKMDPKFVEHWVKEEEEKWHSGTEICRQSQPGLLVVVSKTKKVSIIVTIYIALYS